MTAADSGQDTRIAVPGGSAKLPHGCIDPQTGRSHTHKLAADALVLFRTQCCSLRATTDHHELAGLQGLKGRWQQVFSNCDVH